MAAEMAVIRLTHVADLPDPEALLRRLSEGPGPSTPEPNGRNAAPNGQPSGGPSASVSLTAPRSVASTGPTSSGAATALAMAPEVALARYATFPAVVELIRANRDVKLLVEVENNLRLVRYSPGRIEFEPTPSAPRDLASTLAQRLQSWTGVRWGVSVVSEGGARTIAEERDADRLLAEAEARQNPVVQAVFAAFPGAKITEIRTPAETQAQAAATALPEVEDEWDPFEDS